ncbi:hypothetical protein EUTSA_v10022267mg, partial [Eutrema salsugineum]
INLVDLTNLIIPQNILNQREGPKIPVNINKKKKTKFHIFFIFLSLNFSVVPVTAALSSSPLSVSSSSTNLKPSQILFEFSRKISICRPY